MSDASVKEAVELVLDTTKFNDDAKKAETSLNEMVAKFSIGTAAATKGFEIMGQAVTAIFEAFKEGFNDAVQAERQMIQLGVALDRIGANSEATRKAFAAQADELMKLTNVGDEQIRQLQVQALNYGVAANRVDDYIKAAVRLANVQGTDVNTAFHDLIQVQARGVARGAEMIQVTDGLTEAQIKSGAAIDKINEKFEGQLDLMTKGTEGAMMGLNQAWGELAESWGELALRGGVLEDALRAITAELQRMEGLSFWNKIGDAWSKFLVMNPLTAPMGLAGQYLFNEQEQDTGITNLDALTGEGDFASRASKGAAAGSDNKARLAKIRAAAAKDEARRRAAEQARLEALRGSMVLSQPSPYATGPFQDEGVNVQGFFADDSGEGSMPIFSSSVDQVALERQRQEDLTEIVRKSYEERGKLLAESVANEQQLYSGLADMVQGIFMRMSDTAIDALFDMVEGQEVSGQQLVYDFLKTTGKMLFAKGTADALEGTARAIRSYGADGSAYALIAQGAVEQGVGLSMIGGSFAVGQDKNAGGVQGGGGRGSRSDFASGASSGGGSATPGVSGGNTYVVNVNGVMTSKEAGREILEAIERTTRKGL